MRKFKLKRIVAILAALVLAVCFLATPTFAASYPLIYLDSFESDLSVPQGDIGTLEFTIFPEFKNEEYHVEFYDASGNKIASASNTLYNTSTMYRTVSITYDTDKLDMEVGTYKIKYWMSFYSLYSWHDAPNAYTATITVVPNTCNGNHSYDLVRVVTEPTCEDEGRGYYKCSACGHTKYESLPKAHTYDDGVVVENPTPESDGVLRRTCTLCGETMDGPYSKDHAVAIQTQPKLTFTKQGATAKTTVKATGDGLTYQWYFKSAGQKSYSKSSCTSATYSTKMSSASKDRIVYCVIKDKYGNSVTSTKVYLRMAATITKQPTHASAAVGSVAKTKVTAVGDGLTYQWYLKNPGATKFSKSSVTSSTYSAKMTAANDGRQVYCVVTDKYGKTAKSNTVTLGLPVTITTQPKLTFTKQGATAKTTVKADGDGLTYQWYIKNSGASSYTKSSCTNATYATTMSSKSKDRIVYCVIKDQYGNSVTSSKVYLRMAATITTQPKDVMAAKGSTAKVTVKAVGDGLTYTWYYKNAGASKFSKSTTCTGTSYSAVMNAARDGRQIYCVVTDKYGKTAKSNTVTLSME